MLIDINDKTYSGCYIFFSYLHKYIYRQTIHFVYLINFQNFEHTHLDLYILDINLPRDMGQVISKALLSRITENIFKSLELFHANYS